MEVNWGVVLILLPLIGGIACFLYPRLVKILGVLTSFALVLSVAGLGWQIKINDIYRHSVGGWDAPLGIELYADGLSLLMLSATALVGLGISVYSVGYFDREDSSRFWPLWLFLIAALNALFLSADIFNLYVNLELMGLTAVTLAALTGSRDALSGSMRYLLATLLGSLVYLLGVALLYHGFGSMDIGILSVRVESSPVAWVALGLISTGLLLKTALFPLHFWLPAAHANAPAPVSALLSALVVKASFYILFRLWLKIFSPISEGVEMIFGLLGSMAILWGSLQALRQTRLKLLVAYSTVAQIGYLFLSFPLAISGVATAWSATAYLILSHALAKAAMFLAVGNILCFGVHDRIAGLDRVVQRLPLTASAFALAGISIMGLPPSGGFIGKWLLLEAALTKGRWDLVVVIILGGLMAAGYVFKVLGNAFTPSSEPHKSRPVPACMEWASLLLALGAILLGFFVSPVSSLLDMGSPFDISGVRP